MVDPDAPNHGDRDHALPAATHCFRSLLGKLPVPLEIKQFYVLEKQRNSRHELAK